MVNWDPIEKIVAGVSSGELKAMDLVERALKAIDSGREFNAIIAKIDDRARRRANNIDKEVSKGKYAGRLAGVPFIAKDNFLVIGAETTAGSNILRGFNAPYQATAIEKLESEGAICVAKANLDAFAHGSSTENSDFMITKNPHDKTKVPGGSSGGSAASVVLGMAPFALGTDTGGSIRLPASFTGSVGYKPTYGLVSRSGVVAMASSTDVIGPITNSVEDAALVLECMAGRDNLDGTTIDRSKKQYTDLSIDLNGKKVGVVSEYMGTGVEPDVKNAILSSIEKLKKTGVKFQEVSLPSLPLALASYYIIMPAEVSSNLSRYDGQRYGFSHPKAKNLEDSYNWSRSEGFGREAKRRIMIGTYVLSSGYYDDYYKKAQKVRTKLINEFSEAFNSFDFLIGPTAPTTAFPIGHKAADPLEMYLADIMTVAANLTGIPSISIPLPVSGLPIGMQIMTKQKNDVQLLAFASKVEKEL
ncbi:Asp-tRNA(Asn)/Glu-tRNA(Gln) amidotransferase subunit GatA [Candidatus Saccharibacteria bacterium]|nr:Asp-tRNA(Asn)/Glu-tRNA(Gln) amidotransferase subunit GatA [Candidatus Saccharibacteria bacterium]